MTHKEAQMFHAETGRKIKLVPNTDDVWAATDGNGNIDESTISDGAKIKSGLLRKQYDPSDRLIEPDLFESSNKQPQPSFEVMDRRLDSEL